MQGENLPLMAVITREYPLSGFPDWSLKTDKTQTIKHSVPFNDFQRRMHDLPYPSSGDAADIKGNLSSFIHHFVNYWTYMSGVKFFLNEESTVRHVVAAQKIPINSEINSINSPNISILRSQTNVLCVDFPWKSLCLW